MFSIVYCQKIVRKHSYWLKTEQKDSDTKLHVQLFSNDLRGDQVTKSINIVE